jgi:putative membrane protein
MTLTDADKKRIEEAVQKAESTTSGEIVPLVVHAADAYPHADLVGGIIGQALFLVAGMWIFPDFDYLLSAGLLIAGFIVGFLFVRLTPPVKRYLIGKKVIDTEVYQRALQGFVEHGLMKTRDRTGILIMVSLLEHRVRVLADEGINAKVKQGQWDEVVELVLKGIASKSLADGLVAAIERCGEILTKDFPIKSDDENELSNKLIVE